MNRMSCIYDPATGKVVYTCNSRTPEDVEKVMDHFPGKENFIGECSVDHYIDINETPVVAVERAALVADFDTLSVVGDGVDAATLSDLPEPCTINVDDTPHVVTDGTFIFTADTQGNYTITVNEVAYLSKEWVINVT